ncbi:MAG: hypothetical protein NT027_09245 [Proteobacteria bacterium]|nr:hypothetical protein [Pseudomonadota bacterium]
MLRNSENRISKKRSGGIEHQSTSLATAILIFVSFFLVSCEKKKESGVASDTTTEYSHPSVSTTTTTTSAGPKVVSKEINPSTELVLTIGTTTITIPAGAVNQIGTATLQSYVGSFVNTSQMRMVTESLILTLTKADASDFSIHEIFKDIVIEQKTSAKTTVSKLVALFEENAKIASASKTGMTQKVLAEFQSDLGGGVYKVVFPVRLSRLGFVLSEATYGGLPTGYKTFVPPSRNPTDLVATITSPAEAGLTWKGNPLFNASYAAVHWADGETEKNCIYSDVDASAATTTTISSTTTSADYTSTVSGLLDGKTYYIKVCGLSARSPADASSGTTVSVTTPSRALAVLSNSPTSPSNTTALNISVGGTSLTHYKYAVLTNQTTCSAATYSDWIAVATNITDAIAQSTGDSVRVCVLGKISESNVQLVPTEATFDVDKTAPVFTSLALAAPALDTFLSTADRLLTTDIAGTLTATGHVVASTSYKIVTNATTCNGALTYSTTLPKANSTDITVDGSYKICVRLTDEATNLTYGSTSAFTVDTTISFTSVALANNALDGWINLSETSLATSLTGNAAGAGYVTRRYVLTQSATTCDVALTYSGTIPRANSAVFTADGNYKVCVQLLDTAGNANTVTDSYLNVADKLLTSDLSTTATGASYTTIEYAVTLSSNLCSGLGSWSATIPKANDAGISADGSTYYVCTKISDSAGNPAAYGNTLTFTYDGTPPVFSSMALANGATDNFLNSAEVAAGLSVHASSVSVGSTSESYAIVAAATTCDGSLVYTAGLKSANDAALVAGSTYKVCVKVSDLAENVDYGSTANIEVNTSAPNCSSVSLANDASDNFINLSENGTSNLLSTAVSTTTVSPIKKYAVISSITTCDGLVSFGLADAIPQSNDSSLVDGQQFKVCAQVSDLAGNAPAYCETTAMTVDLSPPVFGSLPLANGAVDSILNIAEHANALDVAGPLTATGYSSVGYSLVSSATACGLPLTYAGTIPLQDDTALNVSGTYKVCVQLLDAAGNSTYDNSSAFDSDQIGPVFTSIALANEAVGGYINLSESVSTSDGADSLVATGQTTTEYAILAQASACSTGVYGVSVPTVADIASAGESNHKICVKLTDASGNIEYGSTSTLTVDLTVPNFSAASLANDSVNFYINSAERSSTSNLNAIATGAGFDSIFYALVADAVVCSAHGTWSATIPKSNSTDFGADGVYKVCVKMTDLASNPDSFGSSNSFTLKTDFPIFGSIDLANDVVDLYLNASEHLNTNALVSNLSATGHASAAYKLTLLATTCNSSLTYGAIPLSDDAGFSALGTFRVCIALTDVAGNITYDTSATFQYDPTAPTFNSLALGADLSDGWLNINEHALSNALGTTLDATGYATDQYAVVTSATTCNALVTYGSMPLTNDGGLSHGATWKLCVKLADASGNVTYGNTASTFQTDFAAPSFGSVSLTGASADSYINASDATGASAIVTAAVGSDYDTAAYSLTTNATTCDGSLTYGAIPNTNNAGFSSDGSYKVCVKMTDTAQNTAAYGQSNPVTRDVTNPTSTVTTSGALTPSTTIGSLTEISGTAADATAGVSSVEISIQEGAGSCYDSGANDFTAACPAWISAVGSTAWTYSIPDDALMKGVTYNVQVRATDLAVATGNVQTSFGSGSFTFTATEGSDLWNDAFVFDDGGDDRPTASAVDSSGNLFVVGWHTDADKNWMIKKIDKRGNEDTSSWNKSVGDNGSDEIARGVAVDSSNNVYVVGSRNNGSNLDWWLKVYNSSGVEDISNWDIILDGNGGNDEAMAVAVDSSANVYVVGYGTNIVGVSSGEDIWIRKYSSAGVLACEQKLDGGGASLADRALSIAVNNGTSKMFVAGYQTAGGGDQQMVVRRLRTSDCTIEATQTSNSAGSSDQAAAIRLDSSGNVFVSGRDSSTDSDWWIKKYSAALIQQAEFNTGVASTHEALAINIDTSGNVYAGGYKSGATQDWWLRQFSSTLVEDTANWDKVIDAGGSNDQITSIAIGTATYDTGNVYVIGWGTNIANGGSGADWWIRKYSN